ncbi:hypothetical protein ABID97_004337 [Variovorax sp. OAS795]|uniref:EcoRII N-terminal effector-binding domain-containing protein n=1 Tax=Variovorax sp. OAS795 TaxID=3034231 RepID=UPI003391C00A
MTVITFRKTLSANDVGATGGHQGGVLIPKTNLELLAFLPELEPTIKNPDAWIDCIDEISKPRRFRFVYYNNSLHGENGTRNEYRITYMTRYFRECGARTGDTFEISRGKGQVRYSIRVVKQQVVPPAKSEEDRVRIKISSTWQRVH